MCCRSGRRRKAHAAARCQRRLTDRPRYFAEAGRAVTLSRPTTASGRPPCPAAPRSAGGSASATVAGGPGRPS
eukprot:1206401-Alexandrium_andersonii.AAC.1